jgi:hypothetical protein
MRGILIFEAKREFPGKWSATMRYHLNEMSDREILLLFIKTEAEAWENGQQNDLHVYHWHEIKNRVARAPKLLDENERVDFNFYCQLHYNNVFGPELKNSYAYWEAAYQRIVTLGLLEKSIPSFRVFHRIEGLILFGYSDREKIASNSGYEEYLLYRNAYVKAHAYTSIPGVLGKAKQLYPFAQDEKVVERLCKSLLAVGFVHHRVYEDRPDYREGYTFHVYEPWFWGVICIVLLSDSPIAQETLARFRNNKDMPCFQEHMETLQRCETAMGKFKQSLPPTAWSRAKPTR